jgi:hypothetical protein
MAGASQETFESGKPAFVWRERTEEAANEMLMQLDAEFDHVIVKESWCRGISGVTWLVIAWGRRA